MKPSASSPLAIGPAIAISNSARGVGGFCSIAATPPKKNSVIERTGIRWRRASRLCASSWNRIEPKKSSAVEPAANQRGTGPTPGASAAIVAFSVSDTSRKITTQVGCR